MDTIAAIATPPGSGGIGIVRLSGDQAVSIATRFFRRSGSRPNPSTLASHRLYHGHLVSADGGVPIDEVLLTVMRAPHSYTREDVAEIQAHAGYAVLRVILETVLASGARMAEPGEFTRRAFLNGRVDLTQAEAVIDLINAKSDRALAAAAFQLQGGMGDRLRTMRRTLHDVLAHIEAAIDFSEDGIEDMPADAIADRLEREAIHPLTELCREYRSAQLLRHGIRIAVVGRPNVGKSSLMNALLKTDRAIVTPVPGTTRDVIEASFSIDGVQMILLDTAGFRTTEDPVERLGVEKMKAAIDAADLVLLVLEAQAPLTEDDFSVYGLAKIKQRIVVANKWDLVADPSHFKLPRAWRTPRIVMTSALYGEGIDDLRMAIREMSLGDVHDPPMALPNMRQQDTATRCLKSMGNAVDGIARGVPLELVAIDLHDADRKLGEILGDASSTDILDRIFSQFCIGK